VNTISRQFYYSLVESGLTEMFIPGPSEGLVVTLAGGHVMHVNGDRTRILVEVNTSVGPDVADQEFLILDDDSEDMVMGVGWHRALVEGPRAGVVRIQDVDEDARFSVRALKTERDNAPEDQLLQDSELEVFPERSEENWEMCHFSADFPHLERLKNIVRDHGSILFQPFDNDGLRVKPLELHVQAGATFRMQPCRFVKPLLLRELKKLIDQFVDEGVMIADNECKFASPIVIVHKKDGGIRMAVDYREVNLQLDPTANQLPYQSTLFQQLGGQKYYAKVDNLW
jgi:hypothetical protein